MRGNRGSGDPGADTAVRLSNRIIHISAPLHGAVRVRPDPSAAKPRPARRGLTPFLAARAKRVFAPARFHPLSLCIAPPAPAETFHRYLRPVPSETVHSRKGAGTPACNSP